MSDRLKGGIADKSSPRDFDPDQLMIGVKHEMEHTDDPDIAREIAMDHLSEDPRYYEKMHEAGRGFLPRHTVKGAPGGREQYPVPPSMRGDIEESDTPETGPMGKIPSHQDPQERHVARMASKEERIGSLEQLVTANSERLARHSLVPEKKLGSGSNGVAYQIGGNRVMKVTGDESEAISSYKLQGRRNQHVVRIFQVFRFPDSDVFGIVQERLTPLDSSEKKEFDAAMKVVEKAIGHDMSPFTLGFERLSEKAFSGAGSGNDEGIIQRALMTLRNFGMDEMMDELIRRGIMFHDYHSGNIMKRGDQYVITDLGVSEAFGKGVMMPPVLEAPGLKPTAGGEVSKVAEIQALLTKNRQKLAKNGIRVGSPLGEGKMGVAFSTADGKVLKVTTDPYEAKTSFFIMGKKIPRVVQIFKVFRFPDSEMFGILQERLRPFPNNLKNVLNWANLQIEDLFSRQMLVYTKGWDNFIVEVGEKLDDLDEPAQAKIIKAVKIYEKFGLNEMMDTLYEMGIDFFDYHVGNIMINSQGKPTVLDLGMSDVRGGGREPPQLEGIIEAVIGTLKEELSDRLLVLYGQFQPFSKKQTELIRRLGKRGKVILLLRRGPLQFSVMRELAKASFPDMEGRIELFDVGDMDLGQALDHAEQRGSSGLRPGAAVEVYTDDPDSARSSLSSSAIFGGAAAVFRPIGPESKVDKEAIRAVRTGSPKDVLDPHVFSDAARAREVEALLRTNTKVEGVVRRLVSLFEKNLQDAGGSAAAMRALEHNTGILKDHVDFDSLEYLGEGEKSAVWNAGRGRVVKVTADDKDYTAATRLKGKRLEHVVQIYETLELESPPGDSSRWYAVIAEKVTVLPENEQDEFKRVFQMVRDSPSWSKLAPLIAMNQLDEFFNEFRRARLDELMSDVTGDPAVSKAAAKARARAVAAAEEGARELWDLMRKYSIPKMMEELSKNGVAFVDYKGDNIGKRGNDYVLFDVGSKSIEAAGRQVESLNEIRLYHASTQKIDSIPSEIAGKSGDFGPGMYFATDADDTTAYGEIVYIADVDPNRVLVVGSPESDQLAMKLLKAIKGSRDDLHADSNEPLWLQVWGLALTLVDIGMYKMSSLRDWLVKQGYDTVHVPNQVIRAVGSHNRSVKGDYYGILQPAVIKSWKRTHRSTVHTEAMGVRDNSRMVNPSMRSQSTLWSTGKVTAPASSVDTRHPIDEPDPDGDEANLPRSMLGMIVHEVIGGLTRK